MIRSHLQEMFVAVTEKVFNVDNEIPLNKLFKRQLASLVQQERFVVLQSLPQDSITLFGKSQPDIVIYKSDKERAVVGASIMEASVEGV